MALSQASLNVIAAAQASYKKFQAQHGPPVSVSLGQYALESAWGSKVSGTNNFFGIKANAAQIAAGQFTEKLTHEQLPTGEIISITAKFANYASLQEAFDAHATLLTHSRYIDCQNATTVEGYCQALQKDGYATAHNYATALMAIINDNRLTDYDLPPWGNANTVPADPSASAAGGSGGSDPAAGATKGSTVPNPTTAPPPVAPGLPTAPVSVPPVAAPPPASSAPPLTPTIAPSIHVDYGDFLVQFISHLEPLVETAANAGITLVENRVPGLAVILSFFGQKMVGQYVASGAVALEGLLAGKSISITPTNALESMVLTAISGELPTIAAFFSNELPGWISAAVAKIAPTLNQTAASAAVAPAAKPA